jgi:hypothetical protein
VVEESIKIPQAYQLLKDSEEELQTDSFHRQVAVVQVVRVVQ